MELTGMKLSMTLRRILLTVCAVVCFGVGVSAQNIDIRLKDVTVQTAIMELQKKYGYSVVVKSTELDLSKVISVNIKDKNVKDVVAAIFEGQNADITITGKNIVVAKAKPADAVKSITVTGIIMDENDLPVIGAAVLQKGDSDNGVVTGLDGEYAITVPSNSYLIVSCIGYKEASVPVNGNATVNVSLALDSELLEDAIVVGYGIASKKLVSSSIASVKMESIDRGAELDPMKALQGRVTGVSISNSSGIPGSTPMVVVRGVSSISGNSSPLYVVDGIPAESYPNINAADIESMEVLKDASATAIYGSRANAGVILITTKSGKSGKTKVNVSGQYGFAQIAKDIPMANTEQWIDVMQTAIDNYNVQMNDLKELTLPQEVQTALANGDPLPNFDWLGCISRKFAMRGGATASLEGGNEKTTFYVSAGAETQEGYIIKTDFAKYTGRAKFSHKIADWLKLNLNLSGSFSRYDKVEETDGSLKVLRAAREEQPFYGPYNPDGTWRVMTEHGICRHNPLNAILEEDYYINKTQLQGTVSFDVTPIKGLKWTPSVSGYSIYDKTIKKLTENNTDRGYKDGWAALSEQKDHSFRYLIDNVISYNNEWDRLMYSAMVGHSFEKYEYETFGAKSDNYANEAYPSSSFDLITSGTQIYAGSIGYNAYALESYFFRGAANWDNRYILNVSFRADGSSRFPKDNRYGFFPAGSLAWIISNEKFMPKTDVLNELKLRLSVGQTGSMAGISNWAAMSLVGAGASYDGASGFAISSSAQNIKWEKSTKYNVGIDYELFSGRLYGNLDAYYSRTDDLLYAKPVHATTGYTSLTSNIGSINNVGVELTVGGRIIDREFKWDMSGNLSWGKNRLVKLLDGTDIIIVTHSTLYGGNKHALIIDQPISTWYMLKADGIYQRDEDVPEKLYAKGVRAGDVIYEDINGDGDINDYDRQICGKATPDFFGGINSSMSYKGFDLNIFCQYSVGGKIFSAWKGAGQEGTEHLGLSSGSVNMDGAGVTSYFNVSEHAALNYWRGEGTSNTMPRPLLQGAHTGYDVDYNILTSSRFLEDASYFKIKTITLGYNFPQRWMDRIKMSGLRVYLSVDNAFTFTRYSGYDPEASMSSSPSAGAYGTDFGYQPTMRSFMAGVQFNF
ncbi:MAG: TonB-dependent receptor [Bacteroidales bacterium]|nr:TonB-dependent receptor [Bacteroidales bacterium]